MYKVIVETNKGCYNNCREYVVATKEDAERAVFEETCSSDYNYARYERVAE